MPDRDGLKSTCRTKEDPAGGCRLGLIRRCFRRMLGLLQRTHVICDKSVLCCEDQGIGILSFCAGCCGSATRRKELAGAGNGQVADIGGGEVTNFGR
jgi:hypothetical protein